MIEYMMPNEIQSRRKVALEALDSVLSDWDALKEAGGEADEAFITHILPRLKLARRMLEEIEAVNDI